MEHIEKYVREIEGTIKLHAADPVTQHGFTQIPNVILKNTKLSFGAKVTYAMFLSYAWFNNEVWLFAIIWAESKSLHNRLISVFSGCVHFATQRRGVESA